MTEHRSVSQVKEYAQCPHRYYLHRIEKAWERPAAWLPMGLAVHEAAEAWEKSGRTMSRDDAEEVCTDSYTKHTNRLAEETPRLDFWFRSGPYHGPADIERRFHKAVEQTGKYIDYYTEKAPDEVIWISEDGTPAIELPFNIELGSVKVRGYIDQVIEHPKHGLVVRDIKTGNSPGDDFQLGTYKVAIEEMYGAESNVGDYWMGRAGKPTVPYKIEDWTKDRVTDVFGTMDEEVRAERFDPDPEPSKCMFCSVSSSCRFSM